MDNTRVIQPNGMANEKMFKATGFKSRKGPINTGPMYTIGNGIGAQLLMNSTSIVTATNMQFMPPIRTKTTVCSDISLSTMPSIKVLNSTTFEPAQTSTFRLSAITNPIAFFTNANASNQSAPDVFMEPKNVIISSACSISDSDSKFYDDSRLTQTTTEGNTLVNTIKNFFSFLIKPIIDTTTMIVGSDTKSSGDQMSGKPTFWSDSDASTTNKNHTPPMYCDNHCYSSEKPNIYMNFMPDTYFDCDDYIEGGEDTIDFVADSTKIQCHSFSDELIDSPVQPSPKDNIFYDCINKPVTEPPVILPPPEVTQTISALDVSPTDDTSCNQVQCSDDNVPISCPKYVKPNRRSYRRKRKGKGKQKHKSANRQRKTGCNKNRHEKVRHEVEMNIHDDIEDCSIVRDHDPEFDDEPDVDLEIIDVDDSSPMIHTPNTTAAVESNASIETLSSPEMIPSGCIFTRFFRLGSPGDKSKQLLFPLRCLQKHLSQMKPVRERMAAGRYTSETESDDSFILFEERGPKSMASVDDLTSKHLTLTDTYRRQRQLSECSDDFILFEDDADNCGRRYDTTDEDFTDSTDDSDSSEDESEDESDSTEYSCASKQKLPKDNNQPDSGFEEKKVTFNLCPQVHEIRAWKFAYSEARKGKWEQIGRDRERFVKRVNELSRILSPILAADHRQKIYEQRFREE